MFRLVVLACVFTAGFAQIIEEKDAKILKEQRFNAGDGRTGSAFATENEIIFREETDSSGNRIGQYSYIGADGKTYTVKYSAGKEGFRILEGAHIPSTGIDAAPFVEEILDEEPLQFERPAPRPQVAPRVQQQQQPQPAPRPAPRQQFVQAPVAQNDNPFINPHDPTHRNFAFNKNGAKFAPKVAGVLGSHNVPPCAGCEGLNPFVNPFDASHQLPFAQPQPQIRAQPAPLPVSNARPTGRVIPAQPAQFPLLRDTTPAPAPARFFPPGQLKLNRFETGFNFDFES